MDGVYAAAVTKKVVVGKSHIPSTEMATDIESLHIRLKAATPEEFRAAHNVELSIPQTSGRNALRKLLQHLLSLTNESCPDFHFLAKNEPLRTTLDKFLERRNLTSEGTLDVTYYLPLPEPNQDEPIVSSSEWLSSVSACSINTNQPGISVVAGSYAGVPNIHLFSDGKASSPTSLTPSEEYAHKAPIKDVKWLTGDATRFITVSEDESARLWIVKNASDGDGIQSVTPCGMFKTGSIGQPTGLSAAAVDTKDIKNKTLIGADDGSIWLLPDMSSISQESVTNSTIPSVKSTSSVKRKRVRMDTIPATRIGVGTESLSTNCVGWRDTEAISAGIDAMVRIWDVETCTEKLAVPGGGKSIMSISPAPTSIVVAAIDGAVRLVDGRQGLGVTAACGRKGAHRGIVNDVAWLEHDRNFVSAGFDGSLRFWDVRAVIAPIRTVTRVHGRSQCFAVDRVRHGDDASWKIFSAGADGKVARVTI